MHHLQVVQTASSLQPISANLVRSQPTKWHGFLSSIPVPVTNAYRVGLHVSTKLEVQQVYHRDPAQVSDPELQPRLAPRPEDDALFLHGILEGLTDIEARIYGLLADLGATPLKRVRRQGTVVGHVLRIPRSRT